MDGRPGIAARLRAPGPRAFDGALAGFFLVAGALETALIDATDSDRIAIGVCNATLALLVVWRRRIPAVGLTAFVASLFVIRFLAESVSDEATVPFVTLFVFAYSLGAYGTQRATVIGGTIAGVGVAFEIIANEGSVGDMVGGLIFASAFVGAPLAVGRSMRNRRLLAAALEERTRAAEREQDERARRAVDEERARIARELHDVVAHSISVMTVQAEAVGRVADRMPEQARSSLQTIETTGREALTEMRRLLGVLRRDDAAADLAPQPSLGRVELLVQRARAQGLQVELKIEGERRDLPAGVDLAAYRVVQEALADALVRIRYGERNVRIDVTDDGAGHARADGGETLAMRERVALYGGDLDGGPDGEGGYSVRARLPLERVAA
jgi:signal transduction histidine kinase